MMIIIFILVPLPTLLFVFSWPSDIVKDCDSYFSWNFYRFRFGIPIRIVRWWLLLLLHKQTRERYSLLQIEQSSTTTNNNNNQRNCGKRSDYNLSCLYTIVHCGRGHVRSAAAAAAAASVQYRSQSCYTHCLSLSVWGSPLFFVNMLAHRNLLFIYKTQLIKCVGRRRGTASQSASRVEYGAPQLSDLTWGVCIVKLSRAQELFRKQCNKLTTVTQSGGN